MGQVAVLRQVKTVGTPVVLGDDIEDVNELIDRARAFCRGAAHFIGPPCLRCGCRKRAILNRACAYCGGR